MSMRGRNAVHIYVSDGRLSSYLSAPLYAGLALVTLIALIPGAVSQTRTKVSQPAPVRFVPFGTGLPTSGQWREGFRIADMNGDGHLDIVHGPPRKLHGNPVIFLGDGKGSFVRWSEAQFPALAYDYGDVEVADFNRDGHPDIALGVHLHGLIVLTGDGKGHFSNASTGLDFNNRGASAFSSRAIRVTDWNGDGLPDIVGVSEGGMGSATGVRDGVMVYLNQGAAGWRKSEGRLSPGVFSDSITLGDFDGDGHLDIATGSNLMGRKDLVSLWRAGGAALSVPLSIPGPNHYVQAVAAGDFDRDGKADLAVAYLFLDGDDWYSTLDLFYSRADGKWERHNLLREPSREGIVSLGTGHLRNGEELDLVGLTTQGETLVYLSDGKGGVTRSDKAIPVYAGGCRGAHVALVDLDRDGRDELVTSFSDEPSGSGAEAHCPTGGGITVWKVLSDKP